MLRRIRDPHILFAVLASVPLLLFAPQFVRLTSSAIMLPGVTHFFVVLPTSLAIVHLWRSTVFEKIETNRHYLGLLGSAGLVLVVVGPWIRANASHDQYLPLILSLTLCLILNFFVAYGRAAFIRARFPLLFLLAGCPLPAFLDAPFQNFLQNGSAFFAEYLFRLSGIPVLRNGLVISLSWGDLEVVRECSGIRATIMLLLIAGVASRLHLRRVWTRIVLLPIGVLVAISRNGLRIFTLCWLRENADPNIFEGPIHQHAGVPFFLLSLLILFLALRSLGWAEGLFPIRRTDSSKPRLANPHPRSSPGW